MRRRISLALQAAAGAALVLSFFAFFVGTTGREILSERTEESMVHGVDAVRRAFFVLSWDIFRDAPVFGIGLGCWHLAAARYVPRELGHWRLDYAHNEFLQILSETGIVGTAAVLAALVVLAHRSARALKAARTTTERLLLSGTGLALLLPVLHAAVDFHFHVPAFAAAFALLLAAHCRTIGELAVIREASEQSRSASG